MRHKNFITFEGGEGTGKSTAIKELERRLLNANYDVIVTREPGGIKIAEEIRDIILKVENQEMAKETEVLLYAASRTQHLFQKILPALDEGKIVLCDRYIDSSLAYQGIARNIGLKNVKKLNMYAYNHLPATTYFIDVKPEVALKRIAKRDYKDRLDLETHDFHNLVYNGYKKIAKKYKSRFVVIDGTKDLNIIIEEIYQDLLKRL